MSDEDLIIKLKNPPPKKPFHWDRLLSITALCVSCIAAGGALWQAHVAEKTRLDVLQLAQDRPVLHIIDTNLSTGTAYHHSLRITVKNAGRADALNVQIQTKKATVTPDATRKAKEILSEPAIGTTVARIHEGETVVLAPEGGYAYSAGDSVRMSGSIYYSGQDGKTISLPWCFMFGATDPAQSTSVISDCMFLQ